MFFYSMFLGNTFVSLVFQGKAEIDAGSRHLVFTVLCVVAGLGVVVLAVLPRPRTHDGECTPQTNEGPLNALKSAGSLFVTKEMLLLCVTFLYTGQSNRLCYTKRYLISVWVSTTY